MASRAIVASVEARPIVTIAGGRIVYEAPYVRTAALARWTREAERPSR